MAPRSLFGSRSASVWGLRGLQCRASLLHKQHKQQNSQPRQVFGVAFDRRCAMDLLRAPASGAGDAVPAGGALVMKAVIKAQSATRGWLRSYQ